VIDSYLKDGKLSFRALEENTAWMDCGTVDSLNEAANYVKDIEKKINFKIGCIEQIALDSGWLSVDQYLELIKKLGKNEYTQYLLTKV
jgi:glucose-1-phosphate thymidylyltransferase